MRKEQQASERLTWSHARLRRAWLPLRGDPAGAAQAAPRPQASGQPHVAASGRQQPGRDPAGGGPATHPSPEEKDGREQRKQPCGDAAAHDLFVGLFSPTVIRRKRCPIRLRDEL